jgi:uncharacterized membrane protein
MAEDLQEIHRLIAELTERVKRLEQAAEVEPGKQAPLPQAEAPYTVPPSAPAPAASTMTPPGPLASKLPSFSSVEKSGGGVQTGGLRDVHVRSSSRAADGTSAPKAGTIAREKEPESLESKIGSQWFNRIGIVAVLVGVSYFLKYAFENNWIGPGARVGTGMVAGIAVVAWSERFRARGHLLFSWSLKAIGIGTMYLSLWAGFQMYQLLSAAVAFTAMVLVTAVAAALAITQNAQVLAAFALVGGFATPLLLSTGQNQEVVLFTYTMLFDLATLAVLVFRPWSRLLIGAFIGTLILYAGWYMEFYTRPQLGTTIGFATVFFAIFAVAPIFAVRRTSGTSHRLSKTVIVIPLVNATVYFLEIYVLLEPGSKDTLALVAIGLAAVYLVLSREARNRRQDVYGSRLLDLIHIALAVGFLTAAIPLKLEMHWITIAWFIEAAALMWISYLAPNTFVRALATGALALGVGRLLVFDNFHPAQLVANARFATYILAIATLAWSVGLARRARFSDPASAEVHRNAIGTAIILINVLALLALNFEVHDYFQRELEAVRHLRGIYASPWVDYRQLSTVRDFSYSAVWMIYGAGLMWVGLAWRSVFIRWQALVLLAATIVKVFIYDVSQLERGYRIISFIALGVLLLAISFLYQRDWLRLARRHEPNAPPNGQS